MATDLEKQEARRVLKTMLWRTVAVVALGILAQYADGGNSMAWVVLGAMVASVFRVRIAHRQT